MLTNKKLNVIISLKVNFASRMQSNCQPNQIQMAETTAKILMNSTKYQLTKRGIVHVKGKGFTQLLFAL